MNPINGKLVAVAALALFSSAAASQTKPQANDSILFRQIAVADSVFFDAYNRCELSKMKASFTSDVEFYHDQSGCHVYPP